MDAFTEAQIATVKELLAEAKEVGDILGEYSFTSRLKELEDEISNPSTYWTELMEEIASWEDVEECEDYELPTAL